MPNSDNDKTLALAGLFQATSLVQQLARHGHADEQVFAASVRSIFKLQVDNVADVFGGPSGVMDGLRAVRNRMSGRIEHGDIEAARYSLALMQLQSKVQTSKWRQEALQEGIGLAAQQSPASELPDSDHTREIEADTLEKLADVYSKVISSMSPRIIVQGDQQHLSNSVVVNKVRCGLLAGLRAAYLWHQLGGRRWHILFQRSTYASKADSLLAGITM